MTLEEKHHYIEPRSRAIVLNDMQQVAPPYLEHLDRSTSRQLTNLTHELIELSGVKVEEEFERFARIPERTLNMSDDRLFEQINGKSILVTGGSGCIGSLLLRELVKYNPASLASVSRGVTLPAQIEDGVDYHHADIRSKSTTEEVIKAVRPDIIYHLAAQRDPSMAELEINRTLSTNILGTRNVIEAAQSADVAQIVYASTGKTIRPFTSDVYASSKKVGEWFMANAATTETALYSGARFTHIVDNSLVFQRIQHWVNGNSPVRLHAPDIYFYVQSGREAAQLLLNASLEAKSGEFHLQAIRDIRLPISLTDLALGALVKYGSDSPLYFVGYEEGYEEASYPGLYDPEYGELSPLINALEASSAEPSITCTQVDSLPFAVDSSEELWQRFRRLEAACLQIGTGSGLKNVNDELSWELLNARLAVLSRPILERSVQLMRPYKESALSSEHMGIAKAIHATLAKQN